MNKLMIFLLLILPSFVYAVEPLKIIEGRWRGTFSDDNADFDIKDGKFSLLTQDCKDNKIELLRTERVNVEQTRYGKEQKLMAVVIDIHYDEKSKGCPNNPEIFKFYKNTVAYTPPVKITVCYQNCQELEKAHFEWSGFSGYFIRQPIAEVKANSKDIDAEYAQCISMISNQNNRGLLACAEASLTMWDVELNTVFKKIISSVNEKSKSSLIQSQRLWVKHKEAEIQFISNFYGEYDEIEYGHARKMQEVIVTKNRALEIRGFVSRLGL